MEQLQNTNKNLVEANSKIKGENKLHKDTIKNLNKRIEDLETKVQELSPKEQDGEEVKNVEYYLQMKVNDYEFIISDLKN